MLLTCSAGSAARARIGSCWTESAVSTRASRIGSCRRWWWRLTHVDQLRPRTEWSPPYNLAQPEREKARQIAEAVRAVADDLALAAEQLVVPVCLRPDAQYNVEEALAPAILESVPEAQRVKYIRCLRQYHKDQIGAASGGRASAPAGCCCGWGPTGCGRVVGRAFLPDLNDRPLGKSECLATGENARPTLEIANAPRRARMPVLPWR